MMGLYPIAIYSCAANQASSVEDDDRQVPFIGAQEEYRVWFSRSISSCTLRKRWTSSTAWLFVLACAWSPKARGDMQGRLPHCTTPQVRARVMRSPSLVHSKSLVTTSPYVVSHQYWYDGMVRDATLMLVLSCDKATH